MWYVSNAKFIIYSLRLCEIYDSNNTLGCFLSRYMNHCEVVNAQTHLLHCIETKINIQIF